jgi:hypothetical protein
MDFQNRLAIFTAVGIASFSAGLSLTTACNHRVEVRPETGALRSAPPTETKAVAPTPEKPVAKAAEPAIATAAKPVANDERLAADRVAVRRLVVTHAVSEREPIEPAELVTGAPVLAFVELANEDGIERNVVVTFEREGHPSVGHVKLHVPANTPRFRTWARTRNLNALGTWEAVAVLGVMMLASQSTCGRTRYQMLRSGVRNASNCHVCKSGLPGLPASTIGCPVTGSLSYTKNE